MDINSKIYENKKLNEGEFANYITETINEKLMNTELENFNNITDEINKQIKF